MNGPAVSGFAAVQALLDERTECNRWFFDREASRLSRLCKLMAERFARGGRLLAFGTSPAMRSDARHVAVEFVHPVIVGKRALPAIAVESEHLGVLLRNDDIVMAFGPYESVAAARDAGALTIAFDRGDAEWQFDVPGSDPFIRQELVETLYHVLWELVHVFFEHRGLLAGPEARRGTDAGASSFLYPFLVEAEDNLEEVLEDVERSVRMKAEEIGALRIQTLAENADVLTGAAASLREAFARGAALLALGNGGSATDATDLVADFREASRAAIDLTGDPAIITAIANDIGTEAIFSRQVIAYGREGDALVAISSSGNSLNVIEALEEGRRRGLTTVALIGYDGGRIAAEQLAEFVIVTRSDHIPRIQEAQASAYHVLRELVG